MKKHTLHYQIFKKGNAAFFNTARFLPSGEREDVFVLYGFAHIVNNFVNATPRQESDFYDFKEQYLQTRQGSPSNDPIIDPFIELCCRKNIETAWVDAFFYSKEQDLKKNSYNTLAETLEYIYGSAEVIGMCIVRLLGLPDTALPAAQLLSRALQYINFIRDIKEDLDAGRQYVPLVGSGLKSWQESKARKKPDVFKAFVLKNIALCEEWQAEAAKGFAALPRRYRAVVKTACDMFERTVSTMKSDPFIIYEKKAQPARSRILFWFLKNFFRG